MAASRGRATASTNNRRYSSRSRIACGGTTAALRRLSACKRHDVFHQPAMVGFFANTHTSRCYSGGTKLTQRWISRCNPESFRGDCLVDDLALQFSYIQCCYFCTERMKRPVIHLTWISKWETWSPEESFPLQSCCKISQIKYLSFLMHQQWEFCNKRTKGNVSF